MSEGEIRVSDGQRAESLDDLLRHLEDFVPRSPTSGNTKLLNSVAHEIDSVQGDIQDVENATKVQHAETIAGIRELAKLVELKPKKNEGKEKYRSRAIAEFQKLTSEGTARDVLNNSATILNIEPSKINYNKLDENGAVQLGFPGSALDNLTMKDTEFQEIITKHAAAGFRLDVTRRGTFTYLSEADYTGPYDSANGGFDSTQLASDATIGYDGLDVNGDPKNNGGTYAGLI